MEIFLNIIIGIHILFAIAICIFVLLQHGKGADLGAAFGSGASGSIFGAQGAGNFLSKTTAILVALFFLTSIGLTYIGAKQYSGKSGSVIDEIVPAENAGVVVPEVPVTPSKPALPSDVPQVNTDAAKPKTATAPATQTDIPKSPASSGQKSAKDDAKPESKPASKP